MSIDVTGLLTRVAAQEVAALATISVTADAKAYFYHWQESFPYFTNRISAGEYGDYETEELDTDIYTVTMRLIIGHITEGYIGEVESRLYTYIPVLKSYFHARPGLQSTGYPTWLTSLTEARLVSTTGYRVFENRGIAALQVGAEFALRCTFTEPITFADLN